MRAKIKKQYTQIDVLQIVQIGLAVYLIVQFILYVFSVITPSILISSTLPVLIIFLIVRSIYDEKQRKKRAEFRTRISKIIEVVEKNSHVVETKNGEIRKKYDEAVFDELVGDLNEAMKESIKQELKEKGIDVS